MVTLTPTSTGGTTTPSTRPAHMTASIMVTRSTRCVAGLTALPLSRLGHFNSTLSPPPCPPSLIHPFPVISALVTQVGMAGWSLRFTLTLTSKPSLPSSVGPPSPPPPSWSSLLTPPSQHGQVPYQGPPRQRYDAPLILAEHLLDVEME